ncbi:MAG: ketopantoate reductase family protein [Dehalococcoidia bacterium]
MRVLVMGAGGVGAYYGRALQESGHDVTFVARGAHLAAMRDHGLLVTSDGQTLYSGPVRAVATPVEASVTPELVLFTVKSYDTPAAAEALRPVIGEHTAVLTLQNGIDSPDQVGAVLGVEHVLAGTTIIFSAIVQPGVIEVGPIRRITLGELSGELTPRVEAIAAALREAGADVVISTDARLALWEKFIGLATNATLTSVTQLATGPLRDSPEGPALYRRMIGEVAAVGRAAGVPIGAELEAGVLAMVYAVPATVTSSMARDFAGQRRVELDTLTGTVVRLGRQYGLPVPAFETLYAVLKARELAHPS